MQHRIDARPSGPGTQTPIDTSDETTSSFLDDAAHVPGGHAAGVAFPRTAAEAARLVGGAARVLAVGAQSSLTGGATPRGDLVLSTRALTSIGIHSNSTVRIGAGVPLVELQRQLRSSRLYYPPVPTFDGAFVGGTIATNAAGAATFKYGSTRSWVEALTVALANGDLLDIERGQTIAAEEGYFDVGLTSGDLVRMSIPRYTMPAVPKLSAGYFARPGMDLIDLFIGSEGTLGVIVAATLRVVARPRVYVVLITCADDNQALGVTSALRDEAHRARAGRGPLDVAAIEYMDGRALRCLPDAAFGAAATVRPPEEAVMLLLQLEVESDDEAALAQLQLVLDSYAVGNDPLIAAPDDERGARRLFDLREAVPASVNARVALAKQQAHPDIEKTAGDLVVPFGRMDESLRLYRHIFEERGLDYAIWGHASDGNLHPNVVPRSIEDVRLGREAIHEMARAVIAMGGAPLAEHGVGRSALKQQLLQELYGVEGIEDMRVVKRALDPTWKLARGVLFAPDSGV